MLLYGKTGLFKSQKVIHLGKHKATTLQNSDIQMRGKKENHFMDRFDSPLKIPFLKMLYHERLINCCGLMGKSSVF